MTCFQSKHFDTPTAQKRLSPSSPLFIPQPSQQLPHKKLSASPQILKHTWCNQPQPRLFLFLDRPSHLPHPNKTLTHAPAQPSYTEKKKVQDQKTKNCG